jgi:L-lactate dehydrogenase
MDLIAQDERNEIEDFVRKEAYSIIEKKGATYYGIGSCMASITNCILNDENRILAISNYDELSDTYNGYPAVLGRNGVVRRLGLQISADEQIKLDGSIRALQAAIKEVAE